MTRSKPAGDDVRATPMFDRRVRSSIWFSILKVSAVFLTAYAAVAIYGLPALKYEYTYRGRHETRVETSCLYLTFDGLKRVAPPLQADRCPLIAFFPTSLLPFTF